MAVDNGLVVGNAQYTPPNSTTLTRAFAWTATGGMVALGTLGGEQSIVYAVSNGQAVGWANTADGRQHAFKWTAAGGMVDLGTFCFQHRHAEQWNREEADSSQNRYRAGFCDRHHHVLIEFETAQSCSYSISFKPGKAGTKNETFKVFDAINSPHTVGLQGVGTR